MPRELRAKVAPLFFAVLYMRQTDHPRYPAIDIAEEGLLSLEAAEAALARPFPAKVSCGYVEAYFDAPSWQALGFPSLENSRRALEVASRRRGEKVQRSRAAASEVTHAA